MGKTFACDLTIEMQFIISIRQKVGTEYLNTRFPLGTLQCAASRCSVKLTYSGYIHSASYFRPLEIQLVYQLTEDKESALSSATQDIMPSESGGKWETEAVSGRTQRRACFDTRAKKWKYKFK